MSERREELVRQVWRQLEKQGDMSEAELKEVIDRVIRETSATSYLSVVQRRQYRKELFDTFCRYDVLSDVIEDAEVTEVMVNGPDLIFIEKKGVLQRYEKQFSSTDRLEDMIQTIVSKVNRQVNEASPIADARLENGDRVNVVLPPVALNGPVLTIRRFSREPVTMEQLIAWGSVDAETANGETDRARGYRQQYGELFGTACKEWI